MNTRAQDTKLIYPTRSVCASSGSFQSLTQINMRILRVIGTKNGKDQQYAEERDRETHEIYSQGFTSCKWFTKWALN